MWIYIFGGYIFIILLFVFWFMFICNSHDKLFNEGFVPIMTNPNEATDIQKTKAGIYILWFIFNTAWLIFAAIWILINV